MQYEVMVAKRIGIFRQEKVALGVVKEDQNVTYRLGRSTVTAHLEKSGALSLRTDGDGVKVVFEAEPGRERPRTAMELNPMNPEIRTNRRGVVVSSQQSSEKLVLQSKPFVPLTLTKGEAIIKVAELLFSNKVR